MESRYLYLLFSESLRARYFMWSASVDAIPALLRAAKVSVLSAGRTSPVMGM